MSTFGLVHGGGFGAWCWDRVVPALQARGHSAMTVDLSPDDFAAGAVHCADIVAGTFAGEPGLVVVGHSIAGLVTPLAADRLDVQQLVFLHALLPRPGQSVADQMESEPDMFNPEMFAAPAPFWEDESVAVRFLLHDCEPEIAHAAFVETPPGDRRPRSGGHPARAVARGAVRVCCVHGRPHRHPRLGAASGARTVGRRAAGDRQRALPDAVSPRGTRRGVESVRVTPHKRIMQSGESSTGATGFIERSYRTSRLSWP